MHYCHVRRTCAVAPHRPHMCFLREEENPKDRGEPMNEEDSHVDYDAGDVEGAS